MSKHFKTTKLLGMDSETSGLAFAGNVDLTNPDPSKDINNNKRYMAISWGFVVVDVQSQQIIDELYVEVKFDDVKYDWEYAAEKTHGLTKEHLNKHGLTREDAAVTIVEFILKHWNINEAISTIGHNHVSFDLWFLRELLCEFNIMLKFANRHYDTNYLTLGIYDVEGSEELFRLFNEVRVKHNALDDIKQTVNTFFETKRLFDIILRKTDD